MAFKENEIAELKLINPNLSLAQEGGSQFILIKDLVLPEGCNPAKVDALLCPTMRDGYQSRLYLSEQISGCPLRNWNGQLRHLGEKLVRDFLAGPWGAFVLPKHYWYTLKHLEHDKDKIQDTQGNAC